jgi:hypothetical protein
MSRLQVVVSVVPRRYYIALIGNLGLLTVSRVHLPNPDLQDAISSNICKSAPAGWFRFREFVQEAGFLSAYWSNYVVKDDFSGHHQKVLDFYYSMIIYSISSTISIKNTTQRPSLENLLNDWRSRSRDLTCIPK